LSRRGHWSTATRRGDPAALHAASAELVAGPAPAPAVHVLEATSAAVVLGRAQPAADVDAGLAASAGVAVVHRCSGGGAVLVEPDGVVWVDVLVPSGDRRWDDDIGRAAWWLGAAWVDALATCGLGGAVVHHGGLERGRWGDRVCFAGLGPGEVTVDGRKVVGVSQRRTRYGALFQSCAVTTWDPEPLVALLALDGTARAAAVRDLAGAALGVGAGPARRLAAAMVDRLVLD
jgi:lipoate-protein ligase A